MKMILSWILKTPLKVYKIKKKQLEDYQQKRFGPDGDWIIQEKILIQPIQDEVLAAVQKIADKNKFDFIFDKSSAIIMLYSEKKYDISNLVVKYINQNDKKKAREELIESRKKEQNVARQKALDKRKKELDSIRKSKSKV